MNLVEQRATTIAEMAERLARAQQCDCNECAMRRALERTTRERDEARAEANRLKTEVAELRSEEIKKGATP